MAGWVDSLALTGSPAQWAIAVLVVVVIFAPQVLPRLARLVGRVIGGGQGDRRGPEVEVLPPRHARPTMRALNRTSLADQPLPPQERPRPEAAPAPRWWVPAVVCAAIGVVLWLLLHQR